jgi:probable HAF family extracellular repeat protein
MRDLGVLGIDVPGQENTSQAHDINDVGQVTGFSETKIGLPSGAGPNHAFIWTEATGMVDIDQNPGRATNGLAINNHGDVVGIMNTSTGPHAFVYTEGQIWDLNDLIPPDSGWTLMEAHDISDSGEIVGWGIHDGSFRAFALNGPPPVPASSTGSVVALGLLLLAGMLYAVRRSAL